MRATVSCSTHPEITATHAKTLELSTDGDITRRASCVVGVGASYVPGDLLALRGRVGVTISCAGVSDSFEATVSPFFDGRGPLVFRRGPTLRGATFAAHADKTAATLHRDLVERMRAPGGTVSVTMETIDGSTRDVAGVLYVACLARGDELPPSAGHLRDVVDLVVHDVPKGPDVADRLRDGGRALLVVPADAERLAGAVSIVEAAYAVGSEVRAIAGGREPETALLAAGCGGPGHVWLASLPKRAADRSRVLRAALDARLPCVAHGMPGRVAEALDEVARLEPERTVTLTLRVATIHERVLRGSATAVRSDVGAEPAGKDAARLVIAPPGETGSQVFARDVVELVQALRREDVSERTLVLAVQRATGESRRAAYDLVRRTTEALAEESPG